ncbi:D-aminoacid aminotransferase-like PLP-dependent enzymes superfamily protein [Tanacetum coccineum]
MTSASLQKFKYLNWKSLIESLVNDSMTKAMQFALKEKKSETELAFTALVSGNLGKLVPDEKAGEEDVPRVFSMHLHVSLYTPLAFGVRKNGAHLAVVGHGRDVANAKYSDWVRMRKPLEKLRPPSATELLLSNDGDHILEGCLTNFFGLWRKDNMEEDGESAENMQKSKYGYSLELQTAPTGGGVLPGVVREVVIEVCLEIGILVREVAPSWSKLQTLFVGRSIYYNHGILRSSILPLEFGFLYGLRLLQHVDTIRVPVSWNSLSSKTWKEVTWDAKEFEEGPGSITTVIQEEVVKRAKLEGHPIKAFITKCLLYFSSNIL